jgi:ubiquinone/menaquinone biosynthesis C-methylase UbiE
MRGLASATLRSAGLADEDAATAARAYAAAADHYLSPALGFWDRFGSTTIERLRLTPGEEVIDLCCGAGASAIPAARAVGPAGHVLGIDLAAPLLDAARTRGTADGLANLEFRRCDARRTNLPDGSFDVVVCAFGVFFAADMEAFVAEMWRLVRPGGRLAITTWGPGLFEPANSLFWLTVRELLPAHHKPFHPWDEITTPTRLLTLFNRAGIDEVMVDAVAGEHRLDDPADFWHIVLGSGYRAAVDALDPAERAILRSTLLGRFRGERITTLRTDVVYGVARRA